MVVALNRGTQILIDNFIDKHFSGSDKVAIKQDALDIADSILEQSNANLKDNLNGLVTKSDLKDEMTPIKSEIQILKDDIKEVRGDIQALKSEIVPIKSDIQALKSEITPIKSDILALKSEIVPIKNDIKELKSEIKELKDDIKARDGDIQTLKDDMILVKSGILSMQNIFKKEITESKYDLLRWLVMTQIAMVGILVATKLI